jgi:hypothetical protein
VLAFRDYCTLHGVVDPSIQYQRFLLTLKGKAREWVESFILKDPTKAKKEDMEDLLSRFASRYSTSGSSQVDKFYVWANLTYQTGELLDDYVDRIRALAQELGKSDIEASIVFRNGLPPKISQHLFIDPNHTLNNLAERAKQVVRTNSLMQGGLTLEATNAMPQFAAASAAHASEPSPIPQVQMQVPQQVPVAASNLTKGDVDQVLRKHQEEKQLTKLDSDLRSLTERMDSLFYANQGGNSGGGRQPPRPYNNNNNSRNGNNNNNPGQRTSSRRQTRITRDEVQKSLANPGNDCPIHPGTHKVSECQQYQG